MVATRGQRRKNSKDESEDKKPIRKSARLRNKSSTSIEKIDTIDSNMDTSEDKNDAKLQEQIDKQNETLEIIFGHCKLIHKSLDIREYRSLGRVIRELNTIRKQLTGSVLSVAFENFVNKDVCPIQKFLPTENINPKVVAPKQFLDKKLSYLPECDIYCHLLLVLWLLDNKDDRPEAAGDGIEAANALVKRLSEFNERRGMDHFEASSYFYQAQILAKNDIPLQSLTSFWHSRITTAILRSNINATATLYNLLLRVYLSQQQYEQADKFMKKTNFPKFADNNQWSRYYYYTGRIKAVQLEYSNARQRLIQALRKAPTNETTAVGFKQTVSKLLTTVQLLLGEIPERTIFFKTTLKNSLEPYYELTQSVRSGDLSKFSETVTKFSKNFNTDKNLRLVLRLRHNVIKTGIRQIATSYSKISLLELSQKLNLDNADDAEFIVAKAIKDGVIEAEIDHKNRWLISHDADNVYATKDPQEIFQKRIDFCFDIHRQSVLSMRYPDKQNRLDGLLNAEKSRMRNQEELEMALADETDDEDYEM